MIAQSFARVQGFIVPRVFCIHVTLPRIRSFEDKRGLNNCCFQGTRFVVLAIFEILITCQSKDLWSIKDPCVLKHAWTCIRNMC